MCVAESVVDMVSCSSWIDHSSGHSNYRLFDGCWEVGILTQGHWHMVEDGTLVIVIDAVHHHGGIGEKITDSKLLIGREDMLLIIGE